MREEKEKRKEEEKEEEGSGREEKRMKVGEYSVLNVVGRTVCKQGGHVRK